MRVLLTGSTGRLGGAFLALWGGPDTSYELQITSRKNLNLARPEDVRSNLEKLWEAGKFDVIINPAAMSGLEECLDQPEIAQAVNVASPREMAKFCSAKGIRLVHFSTDYVFSGESEGGRTEDEVGRPVSVYGQSKYTGEFEVLESCPDALVCRVSWLFGPAAPGNESHFDVVLQRALAGENQHLIDDKFSMPTYTYDVVSWIGFLLESRSSGIYHLCNTGDPESWFSYAEKVCELARFEGLDVDAQGLFSMSIDDAAFFRDSRPVHTAMVPERLMREGKVMPRHWLEAAKDYLKIR